MILFFDTETTGFVNDRFPLAHDDQPSIVQLAMLLTEDDGTERMSFSSIVNPGKPVPKASSDVHGITDDIAERLGLSLRTAVRLFLFYYDRADLIVAHNYKFDAAIMDIALWRTGSDEIAERKPAYCTMEAATPIINLPPSERMREKGITKPKPPKLSEAVHHFFGEELDGAHNAMVDVGACSRVYFHLRALESRDAA